MSPLDNVWGGEILSPRTHLSFCRGAVRYVGSVTFSDRSKYLATPPHRHLICRKGGWEGERKREKEIVRCFERRKEVKRMEEGRRFQEGREREGKGREEIIIMREAKGGKKVGRGREMFWILLFLYFNFYFFISFALACIKTTLLSLINYSINDLTVSYPW